MRLSPCDSGPASINQTPSIEPPWRSKRGCFETDKMDKTKILKTDRVPRRCLVRRRVQILKPWTIESLKLSSASLSRFSIVFMMFLSPPAPCNRFRKPAMHIISATRTLSVPVRMKA